MAVSPHRATTVILLREKSSKQFEVYLVRRHDRSVFMGGNYVYPGGRVDPADQSPDILSLCWGLSPQRACEILGHLTSFVESMGYWIAGIRELFEEQEATHDQKETTHGLWITPRWALEQNLRGEVILSPPTLKTLEDLSRFSSVEDILKSVRRTKTTPILPILAKLSSEILNVFPWDPEYPIFEKGEIPTPLSHGRISGPTDNTTRVVFRDGRWFPYCRT